MFQKIRFLVPILMLAVFAGCYTQLHPPGSLIQEPLPEPPVQEEPTYWLPGAAVYPYSPCAYQYYDPWNCLLYNPFDSRWHTRLSLIPFHDPYRRISPRGIWDGFIIYDLRADWYPISMVYPRFRHRGFPHRGFSRVRPTPIPAPDEDFARRPPVRRIGFETEIPSAAALRGKGVAVVPQTQAPSSSQDPDSQVKPSPDQKSGSQVKPPPKKGPKSSDDDEGSKEKKREEKRKKHRRKGGMN